MIVYIVTSGEYSDYHIDAVFDNKEKAELYCATHDMQYCDIEEWDTEEVKLESDKPIKCRWIAYIRENGSIYSISSYLTIKNINIIEHKTHFTKFNYIVQATLDRDVSEEKAMKIISDRFAKWKYEQLCKEAELLCK